jgi:hypothetical protein
VFICVYIYLFVFCSQGTQPTGGLGKLTNRAAQAQNVGAKEAEKEPLKYLAPGDKMYTEDGERGGGVPSLRGSFLAD